MALFATVLRKSLLVKVILVGAFFNVLALLKTYPLIWHFATHLPGGLSDPLFVSWILAWDVHTLATDPLNLFNANIFSQVQNTLALSPNFCAKTGGIKTMKIGPQVAYCLGCEGLETGGMPP